jgi:hypothetical protein
MQIKKLLAMILLSVFLFVFSACDQKDQPVDISSLLEGNWIISNIISHSETPPPAIFIDTEVRFTNGGIEISDGPCNLIGGFYEINEAGEVTRSEVHMTLIDCGINEQETAFLRYFDQSYQLSFDVEYLIMHSLQGEVHFVQDEATAIATTEQPGAIPPPEGTLAGDIEASPAITITGRVRGVVPANKVIVLDSEATEGRQAFLLQLQPESVLHGPDDREIDLTGIAEGMIVQVVGHEEEEGILLAGRIRVLALPTPGPPPVQGSPTPVGPITLADVSPEWEAYDFPEFGIQLSAPAAWEMSRMPGGYFFAPAAEQGHQYPTQLTVGHRLNVPTEPEAMATDIVEQWQRLTPMADFYTEPIMVDSYDGIALWNLSPYSCVNVYVAAHGVVYEINFYSAFCNEAGDELTELGQRVLDSMVLHEPAASP